MFTQFKKFYTEFNKHNLSLAEKAVLVELYDRMESSRKRKEFYDKEYNDYYVIYTVIELSSTLEISTSTVKKTLKSLVKKGWLTIKRFNHRNNLIFINSFKQANSPSKENYNTEDIRNTSSKSSHDANSKDAEMKCNREHSLISSPNQTNNNQTNNNIDTIKSHRDQKNNSKELTPSVSKASKLNGLKYTLIHHVNLPEDAVEALFEVSDNKENQIRENVNILLQAKAIASKKNKTTLRFEESGQVQGSLGSRIMYIFNRAEKIAKNKVKYIKQSFINFFDEIINPSKIAKPIYHASRGHFEEKMPYWFNNQEPDRSCNQSQGKINEIQQLMDKINRKTLSLG